MLAPVGPTCEAACRPSRRARGAPRPAAVRAAARPGRDGRPAHVRARLLGARAAPAARRDRVRGGALQQARAARADPGARPARVPEPGDGRARVRDPGLDRVRMARPERPVLAIVGDGSSLYAIQALWSAAHYGVGAVFVILANGGYTVMDRLAELQGGSLGLATVPRDRPLRARALVRLPGASCELVRRARGGVRRGRPGARRPRRAAVPRGRRRARLALRAVSRAPSVVMRRRRR